MAHGDQRLNNPSWEISAGPGIYAIYCTATKRLYVGATKSMRRRATRHRHELRKGTNNIRMQQDWDVYGSEAFGIRCLEEVANPQQLEVREAFWIEQLDATDQEKGYNTLRSSPLRTPKLRTPRVPRIPKMLSTYGWTPKLRVMNHQEELCI